jgi:peptide/nickel transport system permease protein
MRAYIIRRVLYTIPLVLGVCVITFVLFEALYPPEVLAQRQLGKNVTPEAIEKLIRERGWDRPLLLNPEAGGLHILMDTRFAAHMGRLLSFRFGESDKTHENIGGKILRGMGPSLSLTVPIFFMGLVAAISIALVVAVLRGTLVDLWVQVTCVAMMSISILVYIIGGQYLLAQSLRMFPVYGYTPGLGAAPLLLLPVVIAVLKGLGGSVRFYRTIFLEEVNKDYVRTARAKGLSEHVVLFKHVLKNAMIPILTRTVLAIPFLFMGSLLLERFFGIPGLGNMTIEAIESGDYPVIGAVVYLGALLFALGNLLTDISYAVFDPRVRLR